jgi:hypothetical protein
MGSMTVHDLYVELRKEVEDIGYHETYCPMSEIRIDSLNIPQDVGRRRAHTKRMIVNILEAGKYCNQEPYEAREAYIRARDELNEIIDILE